MGKDRTRWGPLSVPQQTKRPQLGMQVVMVLKKEVMKTQSKELEKGAEYRQLLVQVRVGRSSSLDWSYMQLLASLLLHVLSAQHWQLACSVWVCRPCCLCWRERNTREA